MIVIGFRNRRKKQNKNSKRKSALNKSAKKHTYCCRGIINPSHTSYYNKTLKYGHRIVKFGVVELAESTVMTVQFSCCSYHNISWVSSVWSYFRSHEQFKETCNWKFTLVFDAKSQFQFVFGYCIFSEIMAGTWGSWMIITVDSCLKWKQSGNFGEIIMHFLSVSSLL